MHDSSGSVIHPFFKNKPKQKKKKYAVSSVYIRGATSYLIDAIRCLPPEVYPRTAEIIAILQEPRSGSSIVRIDHKKTWFLRRPYETILVTDYLHTTIYEVKHFLDK